MDNEFNWRHFAIDMNTESSRKSKENLQYIIDKLVKDCPCPECVNSSRREWEKTPLIYNYNIVITYIPTGHSVRGRSNYKGELIKTLKDILKKTYPDLIEEDLRIDESNI